MIDLTDSQIDRILSRFDQTHPAIQRQIVARFAVENEILRVDLQRLADTCQQQASKLLQQDTVYRSLVAERDALRKRVADLEARQSPLPSSPTHPPSR